MPRKRPKTRQHDAAIPDTELARWLANADTLLAKRGEAQEPMPLRLSLANWLHAAYVQGRSKGQEEAREKADDAIAILEDIG